MPEAVEYGRCVTIALEAGHKFEFEAVGSEGSRGARLYAEHWKNRRLPLDAAACRTMAKVLAEQRLRRRGLI